MLNSSLTPNDRRIAEHYNSDVRFYSYLGPSMNYSCAKWEPGIETTEQAAYAKWDYFAKVLALKETDKVLDVGCGWGGALRSFYQTRGCSGTGLNVSEPQNAWARQQLKAEKVEYLTTSWRFHDKPGYYDKILVDGCMVHQKRAQKEFLAHLYRLLVPGGILLIKEMHLNKVDAISVEQCQFLNKTFGGTGQYRFIHQDVQDAEAAGFNVEVEDFQIQNYITTLTVWTDTMRKNWDVMCTVDREKAELDLKTWLTFRDLMREDVFSIELMVCRK